MKTLALASAVLLFPLVSHAQATDPKWNAWLGCWELVVENARDASTRPNPARRTLSPNGADSRAQICVEPSGNGATLTTRVANQTAIQQTIVADGAERPITDAECRGTQRAEWSADGRKLFSRAGCPCRFWVPMERGRISRRSTSADSKQYAFAATAVSLRWQRSDGASHMRRRSR